MAHDRHAEEAFQVLRKPGLSKKEAAARIEAVFDAAFQHILFNYVKDNVRPPDPRPECWFLLAEGLSVERIFPDLEELGNWNSARDSAAPLQ
jgi:hypothetical protein